MLLVRCVDDVRVLATPLETSPTPATTCVPGTPSQRLFIQRILHYYCNGVCSVCDYTQSVFMQFQEMECAIVSLQNENPL